MAVISGQAGFREERDLARPLVIRWTHTHTLASTPPDLLFGQPGVFGYSRLYLSNVSLGGAVCIFNNLWSARADY